MPHASSSPTVLGIDFGTSNSLVTAATREAIAPPLPLDERAVDPSVMRSVLYFPNPDKVYYGLQAIDEFVSNDMSGRLIRSIKKFLPMRSFVGTWIDNRPFNLEDIIALFLSELKKRASKHLDRDVNAVVLGRPARFSEDDDNDRYAQNRLQKAAEIAGFKHIEFCPEPLAAAFSFRESLRQRKRVLVADFGGGTSDFTVIEMGPEDFKASDVLSMGGVSVAGDAFDGSLMRGRIAHHFGADVAYKVPFGSNVLTMPTHLMERICSPAEISLLRRQDTFEFLKKVKQWSLGGEDQKRMNRLFSLIEDQLGFKIFEEIERTKRNLSTAEKTRFEFVYPGMEISENFSRKEFDSLTNTQSESILTSLDETLNKAGLKATQIDLVCATGGTARVPKLHAELTRRFGAEKIQQHNNFHSIVEGLGHQAQNLSLRL